MMKKQKTISQIAASDATEDFNNLEPEFRGPYTTSPDEGYINALGRERFAKRLGVTERGLDGALAKWNKTYIRVWNALCKDGALQTVRKR